MYCNRFLIQIYDNITFIFSNNTWFDRLLIWLNLKIRTILFYIIVAFPLLRYFSTLKKVVFVVGISTITPNITFHKEPYSLGITDPNVAIYKLKIYDTFGPLWGNTIFVFNRIIIKARRDGDYGNYVFRIIAFVIFDFGLLSLVVSLPCTYLLPTTCIKVVNLCRYNGHK